MRVESKTMKKFFDKYKARYGDSRMNSESMSMWWDKLGTFKNDTFIEASELLLGSRETAFGWKMLEDKINHLDPAEDEQSKLEKKWQNGKEYSENGDKKKELTRIMRNLIDKAKSKGGCPNLQQEYAVEFVRVWGSKEAYKIASKVGTDLTFSDFASKVFDVIRERDQS